MKTTTIHQLIGKAMNEGIRLIQEVSEQLAAEMETNENSQKHPTFKTTEEAEKLVALIVSDFMEKYPKNQTAVKEQRLTAWLQNFLAGTNGHPEWQTGKLLKEVAAVGFIQFSYDGLADFVEFAKEAFPNESSVFAYTSPQKAKPEPAVAPAEPTTPKEFLIRSLELNGYQVVTTDDTEWMTVSQEQNGVAHLLFADEAQVLVYDAHPEKANEWMQAKQTSEEMKAQMMNLLKGKRPNGEIEAFMKNMTETFAMEREAEQRESARQKKIFDLAAQINSLFLTANQVN